MNKIQRQKLIEALLDSTDYYRSELNRMSERKLLELQKEFGPKKK